MAPTSKAFVTVLLLSLALCQITAAEPSLKGDGPLAEKIVKGIKEIGTASDKLRKETESLNEGNAGINGVLIPRGFDGIATKVTEVTKVITSAKDSSLSNDNAKLVVETLTKFVEGPWKQVINVVQGKHKIRSLSKFFKPIITSLRKLKSAFTSFETALIKVIQTPKEDAKKQFNTIKKTIDETIKIYESKIPLTPHGDSPVEAIQASLKADGLAEKIVTAIKEIGTASDKLRKETESLDEGNAGFKGKLISAGFDGIATKITEVTKVISSAHTSLSDKDDKLVVEALTKFVEGPWKQLIKVVQGKHKIQSLRKFFPQIIASLRKLESAFTSFETALIKVLHTPKEDAEKQFNTIRKLIDDTIKIYETKIPLTPHGDSPVEAIQEALTTFLQAQQELLNVLIGNRGITTYTGDLA